MLSQKHFSSQYLTVKGVKVKGTFERLKKRTELKHPNHSHRIVWREKEHHFRSDLGSASIRDIQSTNKKSFNTGRVAKHAGQSRGDPMHPKRIKCRVNRGQRALNYSHHLCSAPSMFLHYVTYLLLKPENPSLCYAFPLSPGAVSILLKPVGNPQSLHNSCKSEPRAPLSLAVTAHAPVSWHPLQTCHIFPSAAKGSRITNCAEWGSAVALAD